MKFLTTALLATLGLMSSGAYANVWIPLNLPVPQPGPAPGPSPAQCPQCPPQQQCPPPQTGVPSQLLQQTTATCNSRSPGSVPLFWDNNGSLQAYGCAITQCPSGGSTGVACV